MYVYVCIRTQNAWYTLYERTKVRCHSRGPFVKFQKPLDNAPSVVEFRGAAATTFHGIMFLLHGQIIIIHSPELLELNLAFSSTDSDVIITGQDHHLPLL